MDVLGTAVLVHGTWGHPSDWAWVTPFLQERSVEVRAVDLPSHRVPGASLVDDAEHVRHVAAECRAPVALVGWSYGGRVITAAGQGADPRTTALVYVSTIPEQLGGVNDTAWIYENPRIHVLPGDRHVLDTREWLEEDGMLTFPEAVRAALRDPPRRPVPFTIETDPVPAIAWQDLPTTILIGTDDGFASPEDQRQAAATFPSTTIVEGDHLLIFRQPAVVADVITTALEDLRHHTDDHPH
ncbi:alpha/beta fold hydrolase [Georgenia muralis]|uniref:Pimeloyl-ACP methyl ester carboxylesterase n=1 Tax=Georgenia muralis TaxID=154117 RepID=A0A3N4Z8G4_9MICO|nr:alpha/beta hydrolase [Georgenia muralis]RPF28304.1 pimeloyl-ACP methyl ester carboxylesterase [Georgenia muralis]